MKSTSIQSLLLPGLVCLASLGCGEVGDDGTLILLPAELEIGVSTEGAEGFALVDDGASATLARGGQGGFHIWTAPRIRGAMGTVYLDRTARRVSDGTLVLRASRMVIDVPEDAMESWWHEEQAIPSFMCPTPIGVQAFDSEIEFTFELRNEDEELLAADSLVLIPRCASGDDEAFCHSVCGG